MHEREKRKKTISRGSQERRQKKRLPRTKGEKQTNKKKLCKLQWRPITPQSENPTREKKMARKEKKMACLDFYETRQHEPITKKTGDGLPPFHLHTRRHDGKRKKWRERLAVSVGAKNSNTQVSDGSSRNHTHTKTK